MTDPEASQSPSRRPRSHWPLVIALCLGYLAGPWLLNLALGIHQLQTSTLNLSQFFEWTPRGLGSSLHAAEVGVEATREAYGLAADSYYPNFLGWIDSQSELSTVLGSPLIWYWPVGAQGQEVPLEAASLGYRFHHPGARLVGDVLEVRHNWSGSVRGMSWDYMRSGLGSFGYAMGSRDGTQRVDQIVAVLLPLNLWMQHTGELPDSYQQVLDDLHLRPIDGRLKALLAADGPILIYKAPDRPLLEVRFQENGVDSVVQIGLVPNAHDWIPGRNQIYADTVAEAPETDRDAWTVWMTIDGSDFAPPIPGTAIQAAQQGKWDFGKPFWAYGWNS